MPFQREIDAVGWRIRFVDAYADTGAKAGDKVTVAILGRPHDAVLLAQPPFDPEGKRLRS